MSSYPAPNPVPTPNTFNYNYFTNLGDVLTLEAADKRYLKLSGGSVGFLNVFTDLNVYGNYYKNSVLVDLDSITGLTNGIAQANKALILDSNLDITGINNFTATNIEALNSLEISGAGHLTVSASSHIKVNNTNDYTSTIDSSIFSKGGIFSEKSIGCVNLSLSGDLQLNQYQKIVFFRNQTTNDINSYISNDAIANLSFYSLRGGGNFKFISNASGTNSAFLVNLSSTSTPSATNLITLLANGSFGIGLNSPSYKLDVTGDINLTGSLRFSGNPITFTDLNYLTGITAGTITASKALVVDANKDLGIFRYLKTNYLMVGNDFTDTSRLITVLDSTTTGGNIKYITFGKSNTAVNSAEISYYHFSDGSTQNSLRLGYNGGVVATAQFNGNFGIGTTSPSYKLDVSGQINTNSSYSISGNNVINSSYQFIGSGGVNTSGDITTTGRLKCTNSLGFQVFAPSVSNAELRIYCGFGYTYIGNNNDTYAYFGTNNQRFFQCKRSTTGRLSTCFGGDDNQSYPVSISGTTLGSYTGTYGYVTDAGVVSTTTTTASDIGLYVNGRILCVGEIDIVSDIRRKENIEELDEDLCEKFVKKCTPVKFNYKGEKSTSYGYVAQQVIKNGFKEFVSLHENKEMKEYIDEYGVISPEGAEFSVITGSIIPILHKLLNSQIEKNKILEERLNKLENKLNII